MNRLAAILCTAAIAAFHLSACAAEPDEGGVGDTDDDALELGVMSSELGGADNHNTWFQSIGSGRYLSSLGTAVSTSIDDGVAGWQHMQSNPLVYTFRRASTNNCLTPFGTTSGSQVGLAACSTAANQWWMWTAGNLFRNWSTGLCLEANGQGVATAKTCVSSNTMQQWRRKPTVVKSNNCIDVSNAVNGAQPSTASCGGADAWEYTPDNELVIPGNGSLGRMCLDVTGASTANGTPIQIWQCNGSNQQKWSWTNTGTLYSFSAGKCLDVIGGGPAGSKLQIWDCNGFPQQKWITP